MTSDPSAPDRFSLPARLCLLAWDPDPAAEGTARPQHLVRAGALTELAQRGLLVDDDGIATPVDLDAATGDAVLDGLLELVRESRPRPWGTWVSLRAGYTLTAVRDQLAAEGCLRARRRRRLGVLPVTGHTLERADVADALRAGARQALDGARPAAEVSARDAAVVVLASAAGLRTVLSGGGDGGHGHHRRAAGELDERLEELTERSAAADPALRTVVREIRTALRRTSPCPEPADRGDLT
ncbi:GOLPH3/VPS74 family protein [Streptomyces sp. NRRL S-340]|uniref:GOLPH3/VPS74 family protein n=1 Tax=Streptomyces sp. NRRL S-340 TaxID=1463901 RepID=UPI002D21C348|nr:GPP34 family phosphoprotein [Streptomyces sp. NRRL S-340]